MRPYTGGIRHDYKDATPANRAFDPRGISYFAVGLVLPLLGVSLLLVSEPNESMVPADGMLAKATPVVVLPELWSSY